MSLADSAKFCIAPIAKPTPEATPPIDLPSTPVLLVSTPPSCPNADEILTLSDINDWPKL